MNILKFVEIFLMSNVLLIFLPLKRLTKKLGSLFVGVVLLGCLVFVLRLNIENLIWTDFIGSNSLWGIFVIDRLSTLFALLTLFLAFLCVSVVGLNTYNIWCYLLAFFVLQFFLLHTFAAVNMLVFYVMFEVTLIPMFLLIILWGSRQRKLHAMYMFFFYTVVGSFFLFFGILILYFVSGSFLMTSINCIQLGTDFFFYVCWASLFVGFGFKVPIVPFHTWLPEAHVEAPTVGSMILAGLLLKVGTFGMLRFMFPGLNLLNYAAQKFVFVIAIFSIFYASFIAIRQIDVKKIVAYSSVAHMGFVVLGLFSLTYFGLLGSYFTMISHGVVASALFFLVGVVYERYKSRNLLYYGGLVTVMPIYSFFFFLFVLANIAFPFTSNFIGELFILLGTVSVNLFVGIFALFSIVLPPVYSVWMFNRMFYGTLSARLVGFADLNLHEFYVCVILAFLTLLGGVSPSIVMHYVEWEVYRIII